MKYSDMISGKLIAEYALLWISAKEFHDKNAVEDFEKVYLEILKMQNEILRRMNGSVIKAKDLDLKKFTNKTEGRKKL